MQHNLPLSPRGLLQELLLEEDIRELVQRGALQSPRDNLATP